MLGVAALVVAMGIGCARAQTDVPAMSKYVDSSFGFSFWYPTAWTVKDEPVTDPTESGWFEGGKIVRELRLSNPRFNGEFIEDDTPPGVVVEEISAPKGFLIELGATKSASPVGIDEPWVGYLSSTGHSGTERR
jgi:hypothetical protein